VILVLFEQGLKRQDEVGILQATGNSSQFSLNLGDLISQRIFNKLNGGHDCFQKNKDQQKPVFIDTDEIISTRCSELLSFCRLGN
jgi:hypothetical protein